jgi:hypothetical protein
MPACCSAVSEREEFVLGKVRNMKSWLEKWASPELVAKYDESKVVGMIAAGLMPLWTAGKLDEAVEVVMRNLSCVPDEDLAAVRTKVGRYLACFCVAMV